MEISLGDTTFESLVGPHNATWTIEVPDRAGAD
jgi:hypothetical protein